MNYTTYIQKMAKRRESIRALRAKGVSLKKIAKLHGVTKQRIHAICKADKA
jgi:DNA-binding transcriptional MerR regulator